MPLRPIVPLLVVFGLIAPPAFAGAGQTRNCEDADSTPAMNRCAEEAFDTADAELNEVYGKALRAIADRNMDKPYDSATWEVLFRASQRAWIAFRDADCGELIAQEWSGGTGTTYAMFSCKTVKTEARSKELTERYLEH